MNTVAVELNEDLVALLGRLDQPVAQAAKELIVVGLYQRRALSSGRAAELLGMQLVDFIQHTSRLGIPYFAMTDEEWEAERQEARRLADEIAS